MTRGIVRVVASPALSSPYPLVVKGDSISGGRWLPEHNPPTRPFPAEIEPESVPPLPENWNERPLPEPEDTAGLVSFRRRVRLEIAAVAAISLLPFVPSAMSGLWNPTSVGDILQMSGVRISTHILSWLGTTSLALFLLWRDGRLRTAGLGGYPVGRALWIGIGSAIVAYAAAFVAGMLVVLWQALFGTVGLPTAGTGSLPLTAGTVAAAVLISLTAGVSEEIVFRGYMISRFADAGWARAGWWVPLIAWSLIHAGQGGAAPLQILAIGGVLVAVFAWTRNVWPGVIAHALLDLAVFSSILFA